MAGHERWVYAGQAVGQVREKLRPYRGLRWLDTHSIGYTTRSIQLPLVHAKTLETAPRDVSTKYKSITRI